MGRYEEITKARQVLDTILFSRRSGAGIERDKKILRPSGKIIIGFLGKRSKRKNLLTLGVSREGLQ